MVRCTFGRVGTTRRRVLLALAAIAASCSGPGLIDPTGAVAGVVGRAGQPTAADLEFLLGGWRRETDRGATVWQVWSREPDGFVGEVWEANRGVSRLLERMELVLTLDGWRLRPVQFDQFERPYESEPFALTGWGLDWARFENPAHRRSHTLGFKRVTSETLEMWVVSAERSGDERTTHRFVAMDDEGRPKH